MKRSFLKLLTGMGVLALLSSCGRNGNATNTTEGKTLSEEDIGRVFVFIDGVKNEPHPNFGHYKVLLGTETKTGLYSFETFDLVDGKPIGKFIVSYPVGPYYREVAFDGALMVEIRKQLEISKQKQRESFQNLLKKKE